MSSLRVEPGKPVLRYLYVRAEVDGDGHVAFLPNAIVTTTDVLVLDTPGDGEQYAFAVTDAGGQRLAEVPVTLQRPACSTSGVVSSLISAFVPLPAGPEQLGALAVWRSSKEVASLPVDVRAPSVALDRIPSPGATATGRHDLSWSSATYDASVVGHSLWYTADEGLTW